MKPEKKWVFTNPSRDIIRKISKGFQISPVLARILINRGFELPDDIDSFLKPTLAQLYNPFCFKDLPQAITRLRKAISQKEKILIYGDRDVDGITSTTILLNILKYFDLELFYKIPGSLEGYGINKDVIDEYSEKGIKLIITVDCGISNIEEVAYAREKGIDVIITDHHEPSEEYPEALAILNPKIKECDYPFKNLAGVGVTLKLMEGLFYSYHPDFNKVFSIIDFETSGYNPKKDEIIEVAVYKLRNNLIIDKYTALVKPSVKLDPIITEITGITDELLDRDGIPPEKMIRELHEFLKGTIFVAHNANFDWGFYHKYVKKYLKQNVELEIIDTVPMIKSQFPGLPGLKLSNIADFMNIKSRGYHRAENDVEVLYKIFIEVRKLRHPPKVDVFRYLDLVSLGTIADMVPLCSENRILAALGLTKIAFTRNIGLQTLYSLLNLDKRKEIAENEIGWLIAPIINAAGRIETGDIALKLLLEKDKKETTRIAQYLFSLNQQRKERTEENLAKILSQVEKTYDPSRDKVIIIITSEIEHGVTGIVATKLKNQYYRPTFILIEDEDHITGAARSVEGLNIIDILRKAKNTLIQFGGHAYAAGFTLRKNKLEKFIEIVRKSIEEVLTPETLCSTIDIDMILEFEKISSKFVNELDYLRPFGIDNPRPKFVTRDVIIINSKRYGRNEEHLKLRIRKKNKFFNAVGWNLGYFKKTIDANPNLKYDIVYNLQRNDLKGSNEILIIIEDIKLEI